MAEYRIMYDELKDFIAGCTENSNNKEELSKYNAEILVALTKNIENDNPTEMKDMISLWKNQIDIPSQLLLGTRYIRIKDSILAFINGACASGLMDAIIFANGVRGITVGIASGVVLSLIELFTSVSDLDDLDFCIYMQAVCHFKTHKEFSEKELWEWFPHNENLTCNMHNDKWDCEFFEKDKCTILKDDGINKALESLIYKGLLKRKRKDNQYIYIFPY